MSSDEEEYDDYTTDFDEFNTTGKRILIEFGFSWINCLV